MRWVRFILFLAIPLCLVGCEAFAKVSLAVSEGWSRNGNYGASRECSRCHGYGRDGVTGGLCVKCSGSGVSHY